ncbi:hypothetical protein [Nonomuraea sp. NEAU-A123]|uniref:hypothetical protein n=1 Tax=Nonomuraea sp. NEAU-A123 TaxID=2839649 RepID=UPI001BE3DE68|nr:hypothetical protein [Nonomuraea sp. NEAU-A123]MBT2225427.1 hypothetical protein [Nonomuraea sp. NEAU-A123]
MLLIDGANARVVVDGDRSAMLRAKAAASRKSDMPEYFDAKVEVVNAKQADRLAKLPGVGSVYAWRTDFWIGKAHAQVSLCAPRNDPGPARAGIGPRTLSVRTIASFTGGSFRLVLADPSNLTSITAALKGLSGMKGVSRLMHTPG